MTKAVVQEVAPEVPSSPLLSFEKYVEGAIPSMNPYDKAYLGAMYRGQAKQTSDWEKEPVVAILLKKE
jgi:hypothetical protein